MPAPWQAPLWSQQHAWQAKEMGYLISAANLARVIRSNMARLFRAQWLDGRRRAGLRVQATIPRDWMVDCQSVSSGHRALVSLGRYLYRGVLAEKDILRNRDRLNRFRTRDKSGVVREINPAQA